MTDSASCGVKGLRPRGALTANEREEMFVLLSTHFAGVSRQQFEDDLAEKDWVVEIRRNSRLLGFSSILSCDAEFEDVPVQAIYSGDTIVAREAWGSPDLARIWIAAVNRLRAASPGRRCYWLLLTSGFRTYRFLPLFWKTFYPRCDAPTPLHQQRLLDHLAGLRYGSRYDPASGIVRFARPQRLRDALADVPSGRVTNPHIAFFLARNPGHCLGDELACLSEIDPANLTPAGRRMLAAPVP